MHGRPGAIDAMNPPIPSPISDAVHPVLNHALYAAAEKAALAVFMQLEPMDPEQRCKKMERAARAVFRKAGTPADVSDIFACSICCDIIERARNMALRN
jgi:hypothetical protein